MPIVNDFLGRVALARQSSALGLSQDGAPYPFLREDFITLGGKTSPGVCTIRGADSPRRWNERVGYALSGATLVYVGEGLSRFEVDIYAWEAKHFSDWKIFAQQVLMPLDRSKKTESLSFHHPVISEPPLSILQVVVENVSAWEEVDESGLWKRTIKLIQFREPKPANVKPTEGPPGDPAAVLAPHTDNQRRIATLSAEVAKLAAQ